MLTSGTGCTHKISSNDQDSKRRGVIDVASLAENPQTGHSYFSSARWFACQQRTHNLQIAIIITK